MSFEAYKVAVKLSLVDEFSGAMGILMGRMRAAGVEATALQKSIRSIATSISTGALATGAGIGIAMALKASTNEAVKLEQQMNRLKALNLGDVATGKLLDAANAISKNTKGTTLFEATKLITDSQAITGDLAHTLQLAPLMARMRFGIDTYMAAGGKGEGHGAAAEKQFADIVKVMEMRGLMRNFTPERMSAMADLFTKNYVASGGQVKPSDFLAMMKTGGVAGKTVNDDFMFALGHIMQEKGGSRSGTQLMSLYQNLVAGRTTQQVAEQLQKFGLLNPDAIEYGKTGHIKKVRPEGLKAAEMMENNPLDYMNNMILPALAAKGIDINDQKKVIPVLNQLASNRTGADFLAQLYLERTQIANYMAQARNAKGVDALYQQASNSTVGKQADMQAKLNTLQVEFGRAALPIVIKALETVTPMMEKLGLILEKHPGILSGVVYGLAALAASLLITGPLLMFSGAIRAMGLATQLLLPLVGGAAGLVGVLGRAGLAGAALTGIYEIGRLGAALKDLWDANHHDGVKLSASAAARLQDPATRAAMAALDKDFHTVRPGGGGGGQVHTTINIDGKKVATAVTPYIAGPLGSGLYTGGIDTSVALPMPGVN